MASDTDGVKVNHDKGTLWVPGAGNLPVIGVDAQMLNEKERAFERTKIDIKRKMMSVWKCTQCKRKQSGKVIRVGTKDGLFRCFDKRCDGPVVVFRDALDLMNPPKEQVADLRNTVFPKSDLKACTRQVVEKFQEEEFRRGGINTQVEIGRQIQCEQCTECLVLQNSWRWELVR